MKLLFLLFSISAWSVLQKPDTWTVLNVYSRAGNPHQARRSNSVEIKRGDSTLFVQFDYLPEAAILPQRGDKVELVNNRKTLKDGTLVFDIVNIIKG